jgi:hypothetical protein
LQADRHCLEGPHAAASAARATECRDGKGIDAVDQYRGVDCDQQFHFASVADRFVAIGSDHAFPAPQRFLPLVGFATGVLTTRGGELSNSLRRRWLHVDVIGMSLI